MIQLLQTPESRTHPDACVPTQVQQPWEGRVEAEEKRQESRDVKRLVASMVDWYCEALLCLETISCVNQHSRAMHHSSAANCFVEQVLESGHES